MSKNIDVALIGGGIMSATLGTLLKQLEPSWNIQIFERLGAAAQESSNPWNNAGTGHAALCELNYTPQRADGSIDISSAVRVNEQFQVSRQFWSHLVEIGALPDPKAFINSTPHMSFVWGSDNVEYLRKRHDALKDHPLFEGMEYSEDASTIRQWAPLLIPGRKKSESIAATHIKSGTDVDFGALTRLLLSYLTTNGAEVNVGKSVTGLRRQKDGTWKISLRDEVGRTPQTETANFVFVGAGGNALNLLQKSGIPEAKDYAAFPVGGSFLVTENQDIAMQHMAKAYGIASTGAPPMSVPHLDTRVLDGKRVVLFGPFATFSTKFLKEGSYLDLLTSTTLHNIWPMTKVGIEQYPLVEYLAGQLMLSDDDRYNALKEYFPNAKKEDWRLWQAGQRVQIIKRDEEKGGVLKLGTEIVASQDGSIAGLLGASPGASTAAPIMLSVLEKVFKDKVATPAWQEKLHQIVPSYGTKLNTSPEAVAKEWAYTAEVLQLTPPPPVNNQVVAPAAASDKAVAPKPSNPAADMAL